jgi:hypothetical protein
MPLIKIADAFKFYKGSDGQVAAAVYLDSVLTDEQKTKFQELYRTPPEKKSEQAKQETYIYMKWSGEYDEYGLKIFGFYFMNSDTVVDKVAVCSGQSYAQDVVWPLDDYSGSMRPCPEGAYDLGAVDDLGYDPGSSDGFGQYVIPLLPRASIQRSQLLVHADRNRSTSPGSAGCTCPFNPENMLKIIGWMRQHSAPKYLIVDHGLGFLKQEGVNVPALGKA